MQLITKQLFNFIIRFRLNIYYHFQILKCFDVEDISACVILTAQSFTKCLENECEQVMRASLLNFHDNTNYIIGYKL